MTESIETLPDYAAAAAELLGGEAVLGVRVETRAQLEALAERGQMNLESARALAGSFGIDVVQGWVDGHPATIFRELASRGTSLDIQPLGKANARRLVQTSLVLAHAIHTFGSPDTVQAWLHEHVGALRGKRPMDLLEFEHFQEIEDNLFRIEYGIYA